MKQKVIKAINKCIDNYKNELLHLSPKRTKTARILDYKIKFLEYMRDNALGNKNAKPLDVVMNKIGYHKSKNYFQQSIVIKFKKEGDIFIGSSANGIFVVISKEDALLASEFYITRIKSENKHLSNLEKIMFNYGKPISIELNIDEDNTSDFNQ